MRLTAGRKAFTLVELIIVIVILGILAGIAIVGYQAVIARTRKLVPVLIPLFVNALSRAEILIIAMNARCYRGGEGRTKRRTMHATTRDVIAGVIVLLFGILGAYIGRTMGI